MVKNRGWYISLTLVSIVLGFLLSTQFQTQQKVLTALDAQRKEDLIAVWKNLDDKNRLTLPAKFRDAFGDGGVVTRGMDGCLVVYTREGWERFVSVRLEGLDTFSREARQITRFLFSAAAEAERQFEAAVTLFVKKRELTQTLSLAPKSPAPSAPVFAPIQPPTR